jgi:flagellar FliL protein
LRRAAGWVGFTTPLHLCRLCRIGFWHAHCSTVVAGSVKCVEKDEKMPEEEEQKQVAAKPKSKKLLIILAIVIVLLGGAGAGAYFKFFKTAQESSEEKKHEALPIYQELDTFMVNLADAGGKRFLKASIRLKVSSPQAAEECKVRSFEIRDIVITLLTSKESDDVVKPEDKLTLKKQIMEAINRALQKGQVLDVYFTDFLIQ